MRKSDRWHAYGWILSEMNTDERVNLIHTNLNIGILWPEWNR